MENMKTIELSDRDWINELLKEERCPSLEFSFTTMFLWSDIYDIKVGRYKDSLLVSYNNDRTFLFPAGRDDKKEVIDYILENYSDKVSKISGMCEMGAEYISENYEDVFDILENRDMSDYIYTFESLSTLKGKKLSSKRNHINRFIENNPDWRYEKITKDNIHLVDIMHDKWCELAKSKEKDGLEEEKIAVKKALKHYFDLELSGGMIMINDEPIAFSIGDRLNDTTFLVHIEKAYADIQGAYPIINREFVKNECVGYEFINREEDTGDEGLRKAKLSYNPALILPKYSAVLRKKV